MKKLFSILLVAALATPMFAEKQTPEERATADYSTWLPQAGEFSIGFNLNPLATYVGQLFNGTMGNAMAPWNGQALQGNNAFNVNPAGSPNLISIMGSYMLSDNLAAKANIGFGINTWTTRAYVQDDAAKILNPYSTADGLDQNKQKRIGASVSLGIEYRVGKTRPVQGVFGAGLTYGCWAVQKSTYTYYNAITEFNQDPSNAGLYTGGANPKIAADYAYLAGARCLSQYTNGGTHIVGIYGSVGVEWFVAPKIALGANVNLLFDYQWNPYRAETWEGWDLLHQKREEITIHDRALSDGFSFTTDNIGANLYVSFYFGN